MNSIVSEKAQFILSNTQDGDNLSSSHLSLVQYAVNDYDDLSDEGRKAFDDLYENVKTGYVRPWFLGIEHLTRDLDGHVYWRGVHVEGYDHDHWCQEGWQDEMLKDAQELARTCRMMEAEGIEVDMKTYFEFLDKTREAEN